MERRVKESETKYYTKHIAIKYFKMFWDPQKVPVSSQIVRNIQNISTNKINVHVQRTLTVYYTFL